RGQPAARTPRLRVARHGVDRRDLETSAGRQRSADFRSAPAVSRLAGLCQCRTGANAAGAARARPAHPYAERGGTRRQACCRAGGAKQKQRHEEKQASHNKRGNMSTLAAPAANTMWQSTNRQSARRPSTKQPSMKLRSARAQSAKRQSVKPLTVSARRAKSAKARSHLAVYSATVPVPRRKPSATIRCNRSE